ncbi:MAG: VWA domain-containing protein [Chloroflexi bacterium]|nr:VWA domain-containing protein [Chloroflexota bacterium]MDA1003413.1 VWA domain-containing protein [Chloroflexota bacterium]MQC27806.1 VWA domain-containing protein [Chloroflexota bacterium]
MPLCDSGLLSGLNTRVTHACLNKDKELINATTGADSDPQTVRGQVLTNNSNAVAGAIAETQRQWADFRAAIIAAYGPDEGNRMILAIAQDVPKVDLVFAIDTTGSMGPYIAAVVTAANDIVDALSGRGTPARRTDYRVGLVDYKDVDSDLPFFCADDPYAAIIDLPFSTTRTSIVSAIGTLPGKVSGGCDWPEDVLSGIQMAVGFPWRDGVNKAIIVMGDAPGHDSEAHSGLTSASVIAAALAVDPAVIYPILVGFDPDATAFMRILAVGTGGQTFDGTAGNVGQAVLDAIAVIVSTPPADTTRPAVTVTFPAPPAGQGG